MFLWTFRRSQEKGNRMQLREELSYTIAQVIGNFVGSKEVAELMLSKKTLELLKNRYEIREVDVCTESGKVYKCNIIVVKEDI